MIRIKIFYNYLNYCSGILYGQSVRGRYIDDNGNFDNDKEEIVIRSQCREK